MPEPTNAKPSPGSNGLRRRSARLLIDFGLGKGHSPGAQIVMLTGPEGQPEIQVAAPEGLRLDNLEGT